MQEPELSVVGVTFEGRDQILRRIWNEQGMEVQARLRREIGNKFDKNAIRVEVLEPAGPGKGMEMWSQVGYLPRYAASQLAIYMTEADQVQGVEGVVRGGNETVGIGVNACDISAAFNIDVCVIEAWERESRNRATSNRPTGRRQTFPPEVDTWADEMERSR